MTWNAQINNTYFENGDLCIAVLFENGSEDGSGSFSKVYRQSNVQDDSWLDTTIQAEIQRLTGLSEWADTIEVA